MSHDVSWSVESYREAFDSDEQWQLRRDFMQRWKHEYPEERLVCLARVFANVEFMGCRYPPEVMAEVARMSEEIVKDYRHKHKNKLKRTFVSASDAAEDRARGVKRQGGVVLDEPSDKKAKISFVPQGFQGKPDEIIDVDTSDPEDNLQDKDQECPTNSNETNSQATKSDVIDKYDYLTELQSLPCLDLRSFKEPMFHTEFGKIVLMVRSWVPKLGNIQATCAACKLPIESIHENGEFSIKINGKLLAKSLGMSKAEARTECVDKAWERLRSECISLLVKAQWVSAEARVSAAAVRGGGGGGGGTGGAGGEFGAPIESSVATKMMKLMGWKGGGLGAEAQGIAEPIKPHLQMVRRAGLGASDANLRAAADRLLARYAAAADADADLVFAADFSKEERALLHQLARKRRLVSNSYGKDEERFLVVKRRTDPFSLVAAVVAKGGDSPKYRVFIPRGAGGR